MEQVDVPNNLLVDNNEYHNTPTHDTNKGGKGKPKRRQQQKIPKQQIKKIDGVCYRVSEGTVGEEWRFLQVGGRYPSYKTIFLNIMS